MIFQNGIYTTFCRIKIATSICLQIKESAPFFLCIGIYTSARSFSLEGEGWDEGI
jgi:hypothetical protein